MVGANAALKTVVMESFHHAIHVERAAFTRVRRLVEILVSGVLGRDVLDIAHMHKVNTPTLRKLGKNGIDIVSRLLGNRTAAERDAVIGRIDSTTEPVEVLAVLDA